MYWDRNSEANLGFGWNTWWSREMRYFNHWMKLRKIKKRFHWLKYFDSANHKEAAYSRSHPKTVLSLQKFKMAIKADVQPGLHQDWESQTNVAKPRGALLATVSAADLKGWDSPRINHYIGVDGYTSSFSGSGNPSLEYTDTSYENLPGESLTFGPHQMDVNDFFKTDLAATKRVPNQQGSYVSDRTIVY